MAQATVKKLEERKIIMKNRAEKLPTPVKDPTVMDQLPVPIRLRILRIF